MNFYKKIPLITKLILAITLGIILGSTLPTSIIRGFVTFSTIFSSFLGFSIPLIIVGFIVPGISQVSNNAGKLLGLSAGVAYISTIIAGAFAFIVAKLTLPSILANSTLQAFQNPEDLMLKSYIEFKMTPIFDVTTALIISFILGIGISATRSESLKQGFIDFGEIIEKLLSAIIIPLLP